MSNANPKLIYLYTHTTETRKRNTNTNKAKKKACTERKTKEMTRRANETSKINDMTSQKKTFVKKIRKQNKKQKPH